MKIIGAGLAGLLAAHAWPKASILEAEKEPRQQHKALLRFRGEAVSNLTGIEFRPVTVRKGIWANGRFVQPNIRLANQYSKKVTGRLIGDRSVWSLEPVTRFIAPESFYDQLLETVGGRIQWGAEETFAKDSNVRISTVPMPVMLNALGIQHGEEMLRAAIKVDRYRLRGADVYQTVYFPEPALDIYRASITGSLLIVERIPSFFKIQGHVALMEKAFGITGDDLTLLDSTEQKFGKIVPLAPAVSKALLYRMTREHSIFALGRFATWRNILLDDVVQDIAVIRRLLSANQYEAALIQS